VSRRRGPRCPRRKVEAESVNGWGRDAEIVQREDDAIAAMTRRK
jgi:hypothetical protein